MSALDFLTPTLLLNSQNTPLCVNLNIINCLAILGGGGKTTLMALLSRILPMHGFGVVSTTTTRMFAPNTKLSPLRSDTLLLAEAKGTVPLAHELAAFFHATPCGHITLGGHLDTNHKIHGLAPDILCQTMTALNDILRQASLPLFWLIEADGSAGLPLKAHAAHEPVIPAVSTEIIMVAGLDALGLPLKDAVHRPELAVSRLHSSLFSLITPYLFAHQLLSEISLFSTPATPLTILLNKEDLTESSEFIVKTLRLQHPYLPCYAGSLQHQILRPF